MQLGVQPNRIDPITSISGVSFDEAWNSREHLIRNKESTGRAKDRGDAEELRKRSGHS
ncbi:MAG: hypothetical protein HY820_38010 [Acidobacteria bacterium]|nr:hypothetical protein [Acidobacteriota bacterium]